MEGYLQEADRMEVTDHAKYLGVLVGPGGVEHFWEAPILQMWKVVEKWSRINLGVHWRCKVYNMFAVSILQFYLQLFGMAEDLLAAERRALARVFSGPGNWISKDILKGLKRQLGACYGILDLQQVANAAKMRLILTEPNLHRRNLQKEIADAWLMGQF